MPKRDCKIVKPNRQAYIQKKDLRTGTYQRQPREEDSYKSRKEKLEITRNKGQYSRAIAMGVPATLTIQEWYLILDRHFGCCHYCGKKADRLHQEHKIPISKGGDEWDLKNLELSCPKCNLEKGAKIIDK